MRVFVAIPLPAGTAEALETIQSDLDVGRPVPTEAMHVTLAFVGELGLPSVEAVHERLSEIAHQAFEMRIAGVDVMHSRQPRLVHAGIERSAALCDLRDKVRRAIREAGIELCRRRFRPHVTLARFSGRMPRHELDRLGRFLETHGALSLMPVGVTRFTLFRSRLHAAGADYEALADYPFI